MGAVIGVTTAGFTTGQIMPRAWRENIYRDDISSSYWPVVFSDLRYIDYDSYFKVPMAMSPTEKCMAVYGSPWPRAPHVAHIGYPVVGNVLIQRL
jgi:hypothetical protein